MISHRVTLSARESLEISRKLARVSENENALQRVLYVLESSGIKDMQVLLDIAQAVDRSYKEHAGPRTGEDAAEDAKDVAQSLIKIAKTLPAQNWDLFPRLRGIADHYAGDAAGRIFLEIAEAIDNIVRYNVDPPERGRIIERACALVELYENGGGIGIAQQIKELSFATENGSANMLRRMGTPEAVLMAWMYAESYGYMVDYVISGLAESSRNQPKDLDAQRRLDEKYARLVKVFSTDEVMDMLGGKIEVVYVKDAARDILFEATASSTEKQIIEIARQMGERYDKPSLKTGLLVDVLRL